ncbi:Succinate dehydrogenase hydrophobic membrane anchor protein [Lysobacter dokdonensis DS-58]|uniref:Succinate dehydrogenase hydrophobic membrane anchor subunit n=1 Tax=Lysobacter dokdonensis DS-58 TaxID=1300345 RepID=A0A0A2WJP5_9GAMM|nr:succinate dehydrogenase, hydrophobic membrane anchor protein [Lysobacter dokdonensis]KGQ20401.1 Succinate dehydrogenase hydrophobic membrane anchor protein [Lysobacter dokdonensis DS-58]
MTDLRTPLARARGLGSGKTGTSHFWVQRVTAVALALLVPWLLWVVLSMVGGTYQNAIDVLHRPWNAILMGAFLVAMFWHAKLGIQVIIEDYVHTRGWEVTLQLLNLFLCTLGAIASLFAIVRIALMA